MQEGGLRRQPIYRAMTKRTHEDFVAYLRWGKEWEHRCFELFRTRFPDLRAPKPVEDCVHTRTGFVDEEPDLALSGFPIECKRRRFDFTGAADYPYTSFFIDEEYKMRDRRIPSERYFAMPMEERRSYLKPFMFYATANRDMTHMGVVIPASKPYWHLETRTLHSDQRQGDSWACQLNKVLWCPVDEWRSILTRV